MANTTIQIKRSSSTASPTTLSPGELAFSFVSNTLFVGNSTSGVVQVASGNLFSQSLVTPGSLTASKVLVADGNTFIDKIVTGNLTLSSTSGGTSYSVNAISNDTTLASNAANILPTQKAVKTYVDVAVAAATGAPGGSNTYVQFNDSGAFGGDAGLTYNKNNDTLTVSNTVVVGTATVNSTYYTGTASNANNLGGQLPSYYLNASNFTTGTLPTAQLTGTYDISISGTAANASALNNQPGSYYTNATNITTGTLAEPRLPFRMDQNVTTTSTVTFNNLVISQNLVVYGNTTYLAGNNVSFVDNMIYLNSNSTNSNPDLGFAGNYNDGTYAHAGFFRDHTSGIWKVYDGYKPEPDAAVNIDQTNTSFRVATFQANNVRLGNNSVYGDINKDNYTGTANNATYFDGRLSNYYLNTDTVFANSASQEVIVSGNYNALGVNLSTTGVVAGTYGNTTSVPGITVDSKGRITSVTQNPVATAAPNATYVQNTDSRVLSGNLNFTGVNNYFSATVYFGGASVNSSYYTGTAANANTLGGQAPSFYLNTGTSFTSAAGQDVSISGTYNALSSNLGTTGVVAGSYGNNSYIPAFTVDARGRLSLANTVVGNAVAMLGYTPASKAGDTFTGTTDSTSISTGTVIVNGGVGVAKNLYANGSGATAHFNNVNAVNIGVSTDLDVAGKVYIRDATTSSGLGTGAVQLTGGLSVNKDVVIGGNLTVSGVTTLVNSNTVSIGDSLIKLAANNLTTDTSDIGFYGAYGSQVGYAGLARLAGGDTIQGLVIPAKAFVLFSNTAAEPSNIVSASNLGTLAANLLSSNVTFTTALSVSSGGTGASTLTANGVLLGNGTNPITSVSTSTDGQVLLFSSAVNGPVFSMLDGGTF